MKKLTVLAVLLLFCLMASCESKAQLPDLYEYATSLTEPELLVLENGTLWRLTEQREIDPGSGDGSFVRGTVEFVRELEPGEMNPEVSKMDAGDMSLWEYAVLTWEDDRVAVAQDGSVWCSFSPALEEKTARKYEPAEDIGAEQLMEGFWLEQPEAKVNERGQNRISIVLHDDSGTLINPGIDALDVLIGGEWYPVPLNLSGTLDVKFFEDGIYNVKGVPLSTGDPASPDIPVPSGHYRLRASAYTYEDWDAKNLDSRKYALIEFDLTYKNGEYKIE